jgi:hypothetical protein
MRIVMNDREALYVLRRFVEQQMIPNEEFRVLDTALTVIESEFNSRRAYDSYPPCDCDDS